MVLSILLTVVPLVVLLVLANMCPMKGNSPVQDRIRRVLKGARTVEPYPVNVSWKGIAKGVYGCRYVSEGDIRNVQRAVERMSDVFPSYFKGGRRRAGAYLIPSPAQEWLKSRIRRQVPGTTYLADSSSYVPAKPDEILRVFLEGCQEEFLPLDLLVDVTVLVNEHCKVALDLSEVAWWRVGLEETRKAERRDLHGRLRLGMVSLCVEKERLEVEARKVSFGPIRFDPVTVGRCPCCRQSVSQEDFTEGC